MMSGIHSQFDAAALKRDITRWGRELGFQAIGITHLDLAEDEAALERWLALGRHGEMDYMARHGRKRTRPADLVPGTLSVICVRMDYLPADAVPMQATLDDPEQAYVSRYALGRDYHKLLRGRLQKLAERIDAQVGGLGYRVFTDSAPVLEKPLARNAGLGWIGKHTNLIDSRTGSWFFLGELYTDLPLAESAALPSDHGASVAVSGPDLPRHAPSDRIAVRVDDTSVAADSHTRPGLHPDQPASEHCGSCRRCIDACPTGAIVAPFELDARLCISYLTIELHGSIPVELRPMIGNRIYGCDDCQLVCPWNKFAQATLEPDFAVRHGLDRVRLVDLFAWDEDEFLAKTEGSAIRRIGHERWLRNLAVALGNAPTTPSVLTALRSRRAHRSAMVREHVAWALGRHGQALEMAGEEGTALPAEDGLHETI